MSVENTSIQSYLGWGARLQCPAAGGCILNQCAAPACVLTTQSYEELYTPSGDASTFVSVSL